MGYDWKRVCIAEHKHESECPFKTPDYCHSIEAAWEIVEWCRTHKRQFHLDTTNVSWYCLIGHSQNGSLVFPGEALTAPMAICLAFLKLK